MSAISQSAIRVAAKQKGGSPEDARQGNNTMNAVAERVAPLNRDIAPFIGMSENKKLGTWLDRLVAEAATKGKPVVRTERLTPEMAALLLERNPDNRKMNLRIIDTFATDISGGRWALNGEPIIISDTGELNDGQHRCQAVVQAGKPIDVVMVVGVPRSTRTTLDQGRVRTIGDYLAMDGHADSVVLGAAGGYLWSYRNRGRLHNGGSGMTATKGEIREVVASNPGLSRSVAICGRSALPVGGRSVLAFCHFVFSGANREAADQFILSLMDGVNLKVGDPILYARNRLIQERGTFRAAEKSELLFKAWNAWRRGDKITSFTRITGDVLPVLES